MRRCGIGLSILMLGMVVGVGTSRGQGTTPAAVASTPNPPTAPATKRTVRRSAGKPARSTQVIGQEAAPPSPPSSPADEAARRAKDQRLLDEQKRQSAAAAQIANREVERAQRQQDRVQKEVRIQDAPGPVQTLPPPTQPSHPPDEGVAGSDSSQ